MLITTISASEFAQAHVEESADTSPKYKIFCQYAIEQKFEKVPDELFVTPTDLGIWRFYRVPARQLKPFRTLLEDTPLAHIVGKTPDDEHYVAIRAQYLCDIFHDFEVDKAMSSQVGFDG
ncbi:hypothetical protein LA080_007197 [Diaporthe eres]|nr:hypothetical protein LA080_007197 [Diaporthe eres]